MAGEMGPISERTKTTMWVPPELMATVKQLSRKLGVSRTAFFTFAAAQYVVELSPHMGPGVKRRDALKKMEGIFTSIIERAEKGL